MPAMNTARRSRLIGSPAGSQKGRSVRENPTVCSPEETTLLRLAATLVGAVQAMLSPSVKVATSQRTRV